MVRGLVVVALLGCGMGAAAQTAAGPTGGEWGDQGDGTYANPVMPGDFSDLDAIRVGDRFYAISSTFGYSPGMLILESRDLVNWSYAGHVVEDVTRISPAMNWDKMDRPGRGIWAGSIRFHAGRFWVYFGTTDEGIFMSSAAKVTGPWTPVVPVISEAGWDDPCPFWDDDGRLYLVTSRTRPDANGKSYNIHLFELNAAGDKVLQGTDRVIHQSRGSEANKLYKWNGMYFHYYSEVKPEGRVVMMERARSLAGPWEIRQLNHVHGAVDKEPNQGGIIELKDGTWWFLTHQGKGDWEGRAGVLLPVTWVDGWPVPGSVGEDGVGNMVWGGKKPLAGGAKAAMAVSDDFSAAKLRPAWEWNYQPRAGMWSLTERPGYLRMRAFKPLRPGFEGVGDVLTQRAMRTAANEVTVKLDVSGMVDGQEAGVAHYARTYSTLGVVQRGKERAVSLNMGGVRTEGAMVPGTSLWVRSSWGFDGISRWSYSVDGKEWRGIGEGYPLTWAHYRGDRIGLFTVNEGAEKGFVDFDSFGYEVGQVARWKASNQRAYASRLQRSNLCRVANLGLAP